MDYRLKQNIFSSFLMLLACGVVFGSNASSSLANGPRVLPEGKVPHDRRLQPLKDYDGYFPFEVPPTSEQWEKRAQNLRRRILVATGLWPMPKKTPLNPVIHGRFSRAGFTVDKVYFESYPGHYVTGLLFRPQGKTGRLPAVLCPHGHGGRLQDYGADKIREMIVAGEERFEGSGRYPKLARCAQLARMGCVTFIFDMLGYADSVQVSYHLAHRYGKERPEFDTKKSWGFYSTQAEMRLQSIMGVQSYNCIRALDFLSQLPDVDPQRIGVTGGSGGGTQTILLCAVDPRPIVAFPQGMVSTSMQGGCTCENCNLLRIGTGNVELAALFAPKPLAMTGANDWTKEIATKGYPELKQLYRMLGVENKVRSSSHLHFPHNYNYVTRAIMYRWFNKHLNLGLKDPVVEEDFPPLTGEELTVWDKDHPRPQVRADYERSLTRYMDQEATRQIEALRPKNASSLKEYRRVIGGAIDTIIGRRLPQAGMIEREKISKVDRGSYLEFGDLLRLTKQGEELPVVSLFPKKKAWNRQVVIWIDGRGKSGLYDPDGTPCQAVRRLLDSGASVISADLLFQGEFLSAGKEIVKTRNVKGDRDYSGFTFGYNHPLMARRVHDILTLLAFVRADEHKPERVDMVGVAGAGPWVAAARAQAGGKIDRAFIDTQGFRFANLTSYRDVNFLPGVVKYGDLPGILSLSAPHRLALAGEQGKIPRVILDTYRAAGKSGNVNSLESKPEDVAEKAVDWLLSE